MILVKSHSHLRGNGVGTQKLSKEKTVSSSECTPSQTLNTILGLSVEEDGFDWVEILSSRMNYMFASQSWPRCFGQAKYVLLGKIKSQFREPD